MKVGFLGNANNYPFMLARAVRRAGHDVLFVLNHKGALNRPENRYDDVEVAGTEWILDAGDLETTERFQFPAESPLLDRVVAKLRECDAVILNHGGLSLAPLIGRPHIALLTGTDIQDLAVPAHSDQARGYRVVDRLWLDNAIARQRAGIASAIGVSVFYRGLVPRYDATLDALGVTSDRRFFCWMTDPHRIAAVPAPKNDRIRIFNLARLTWKTPREREFNMDHKATDLMILGLARFIERHPGVNLDVRLVEKGAQVREARQLVESSGLSSRVTWLKEMNQRQVLEEYQRADIVFDQLGLSVVAMGGLDVLSVGRPLIANGRPDVMRHYVPEPPICQAATVDEVVGQLERLVLNTEERVRVGQESRAYVEQHCSADASAAMCIERIEAVLSNPTRYSSWSGKKMEARERLAEEREERLKDAEAVLAAREAEIVRREGTPDDLVERESRVRLREHALTGREELTAKRETDIASREAQVAQLQTLLSAERAELDRSFKVYDSLPIVRWQRSLKAWMRRLTGRDNQG